MRHISNQGDWFYEFRPYLIIAIAVVGLIFLSGVGGTQALNAFGFLCGIVLLGTGISIISMRKDYRKSSFMK